MSYSPILKTKVFNRGVAPDSFLTELIASARKWPAEIVAPNPVPVEVFTVIRSRLAEPAVVRDGAGGMIYTWPSLLYRKAALCETMRVHAGMEASWEWGEGVDKTNLTSQRNIAGQETGIFQVSYDTTYRGVGRPMEAFLRSSGMQIAAGPKDTKPIQAFIDRMKSDHVFALEYYARLVRVSIAWAGPFLRHGQDSIYPWLSRAAVAEFQRLLN